MITSREIADRFRSQGYFFSSTGGSPLSCAIGITVLDVLRDEGLQQNAARVGAHLKARLQALQDKHPIIGTVHGIGLYLGVEMVRDRDSLEPAAEETAAICDRMLELGVVIQPTGDQMNILKTKPPLCIDIEARRLLRRRAGPGADRRLLGAPSQREQTPFAKPQGHADLRQLDPLRRGPLRMMAASSSRELAPTRWHARYRCPSTLRTDM